MFHTVLLVMCHRTLLYGVGTLSNKILLLLLLLLLVLLLLLYSFSFVYIYNMSIHAPWNVFSEINLSYLILSYLILKLADGIHPWLSLGSLPPHSTAAQGKQK